MLIQNDQQQMQVNEQEATFMDLQVKLALAPIFQLSILDCSYQLHIDWKTLGIRAIHIQMDDEGKEFVVAYISKSNNNVEAQYSSYDAKCLATMDYDLAHLCPS